MLNPLANAPLREEFRATWLKFAKRACLTRGAIRNSLQKMLESSAGQANKVLKTKGILSAKHARRMVRDRLELAEKREKEKEEACEKRYKLALQKCYRQITKGIAMEIDKMK